MLNLIVANSRIYCITEEWRTSILQSINEYNATHHRHTVACSSNRNPFGPSPLTETTCTIP